MWFIIFLVFCNAISSYAQQFGDLNIQTAPDTTLTYQGFEFNEHGHENSDDNFNNQKQSINYTQKEISDHHSLFPSQWRTEDKSTHFIPYAHSHNKDQNSENLNEQEIKAFAQFQAQENLQTVPFSSSTSEDDKVTKPFVNNRPYLQISRSYPIDQFPPTSTERHSPMSYPDIIRVNIKRSYSNNFQDKRNSSETSSTASEPTYSRIEQNFTGVLPTFPFPARTFMPNQILPFARYFNPYYNTGPSPFLPLNKITPSSSMNPVNQEQNSPYLANSDSQNFKPAIEIQESTPPLSSADNLMPYDVPRRILVGSVPFLNAPTDQFPFPIPSLMMRTELPRPRVPIIMPPIIPLIPGQRNIPRYNDGPRVFTKPLPTLPPAINVNQPEETVPETISVVAGKVQSEEQRNDASLPYEFGYDMNDGKGTQQHRVESSDSSGVVRGSYGYRDLFGVYRVVNYIADKFGYRAFVKSNEPGVASSGSADVVINAEQPPPQVVAESLKPSESESIIVQSEPIDVTA